MARLTPVQVRQIAARVAAISGGAGGGGSVAWAAISGKPSTFAPAAHGHAVSDVTGLQTALDGKQAAGSYAAATHTHSIANVTGLQTALDGKQAAGSYLTDAPSDDDSYARRNGAWIAIPRFLTYAKAADETRVNNAGYVADADMVSETLLANAIYRFELMLLCTGDTAQDIRFRVERTGLSDATLRYTGDLDGTPSTNDLTWNSVTTFNLAGTAYRYGNFIGVLMTGSNTGTVQVTWGQAVAGTPTAATTMKAGSMMMLRRVA